MIKSILVYTSSGQILYKWEIESKKVEYTHTILVPGFFSALNSVLSNIFQDRLQRLILENNAIVLIGKEIKIKHNQEFKQKLILISALVDLDDDTRLINNLLTRIFEILSEKPYLEEEKLITDDKFDKEISMVIYSKIYSRTSKKLIISTFLVILSLIASTFIYLFNYAWLVGPQNSSLISYIVGIISAGLFIIPMASIAGNRKNSGFSGVIGSFIGALIGFVLFEFILPDLDYLDGFGTPIIYFSLSVLVGLVYGMLGGYIMEKRFLNS